MVYIPSWFPKCPQGTHTCTHTCRHTHSCMLFTAVKDLMAPLQVFVALGEKWGTTVQWELANRPNHKIGEVDIQVRNFVPCRSPSLIPSFYTRGKLSPRAKKRLPQNHRVHGQWEETCLPLTCLLSVPLLPPSPFPM
jgi:hypothetical protein